MVSRHVNVKRGAGIPTRKTVVYIDGYNLYHGLRDRHGRRYLWLDLTRFALSLFTDPKQELVVTKYFTSPAPGGTDSAKRQQTYWKALETCPGLQVIKGRYREKATRCSACGTQEAECRACGEKMRFRNEKMTDVNIATHLVRDACVGTFDVAILVGGDTDLLAAVDAAKSMRRIVVGFPPDRENDDMRNAASGWFRITEGQFKRSQFPEIVTVAPGVTVRRPDLWK